MRISFQKTKTILKAKKKTKHFIRSELKRNIQSVCTNTANTHARTHKINKKNCKNKTELSVFISQTLLLKFLFFMIWLRKIVTNIQKKNKLTTELSFGQNANKKDALKLFFSLENIN